MKYESILPFLGILLGWILNESSQRYRKKREDKKAISKALAELLEIRHSHFGTILFLNNFKIIAGVPDDLWPAVREGIYNLAFDKKLIDQEAVASRYNNAVDSICELDPLLGFKLRNKDVLSATSFNIIRDMVGEEEPNNKQKVYDMQEIACKKLLPFIEETILYLAWKYSVIYWFKINRYIKTGLHNQDAGNFVKDIMPYFISDKSIEEDQVG